MSIKKALRAAYKEVDRAHAKIRALHAREEKVLLANASRVIGKCFKDKVQTDYEQLCRITDAKLHSDGTPMFTGLVVKTYGDNDWYCIQTGMWIRMADQTPITRTYFDSRLALAKKKIDEA